MPGDLATIWVNAEVAGHAINAMDHPDADLASGYPRQPCTDSLYMRLSFKYRQHNSASAMQNRRLSGGDQTA
jgi:hypothetical protein